MSWGLRCLNHRMVNLKNRASPVKSPQIAPERRSHDQASKPPPEPETRCSTVLRKARGNRNQETGQTCPIALAILACPYLAGDRLPCHAGKPCRNPVDCLTRSQHGNIATQCKKGSEITHCPLACPIVSVCRLAGNQLYMIALHGDAENFSGSDVKISKHW